MFPDLATFIRLSDDSSKPGQNVWSKFAYVGKWQKSLTLSPVSCFDFEHGKVLPPPPSPATMGPTFFDIRKLNILDSRFATEHSDKAKFVQIHGDQG